MYLKLITGMGLIGPEIKNIMLRGRFTKKKVPYEKVSELL